MKSSSKNIAIGLVVILALVFGVRALVFLHPHAGDGKYVLRVRFQNIDKLSKGTKVTYAGKPVGQVVSIVALPESRGGLEKTIYPYELTLALDSALRVYDSDEVAVNTAGLMGERFIAITPRQPTGGVVAHLLENDALVYAAGSINVEDVAKKAEMAVGSLVELIQNNQSAFTSTMQSLERAASQFEQVMKKLAEGQGTVGKLFLDDEAYYKTLNVLQRTNTLLSDIDNYGLLFHLDKSWQRLHRIRLEEAEKLENPAQIRTYVNQEMRNLTGSFDRLDLALQKAQNVSESKESLKDPKAREEFTSAFKEVLRDVQELENRLKTVGSQFGDQ